MEQSNSTKKNSQDYFAEFVSAYEKEVAAFNMALHKVKELVGKDIEAPVTDEDKKVIIDRAILSLPVIHSYCLANIFIEGIQKKHMQTVYATTKEFLDIKEFREIITDLIIDEEPLKDLIKMADEYIGSTNGNR